MLTATSGVFGIANAAGATGSLVINAGGTVRSTVSAQTALNQLTVANFAGAVGSVTVSGAGALLDIGSNPAGFGNVGTGSLTVSAGGTAKFTSSDSNLLSAMSAGNLAGSQGTVTVSGAGSSVTATGYVYVGRAGTATLTVAAGATFTGGLATTSTAPGQALAIGDGSLTVLSTGVVNTSPNFGGSGSATVTGAGSLLHALNQLRVGFRGTSGTLLVDQSAAARADSNVIIGGWHRQSRRKRLAARAEWRQRNIGRAAQHRDRGDCVRQRCRHDRQRHRHG